MYCMFRKMRTQNGIEIELKLNEIIISKLEDYLRPLFDEWKRVVPTRIKEKIVYPLFIVDENRTIGLNFSKEVITKAFPSSTLTQNLYIYF